MSVSIKYIYEDEGGNTWYNKFDESFNCVTRAELVEFKDGTRVFGWTDAGHWVEANIVWLPDGTILEPAHMGEGDDEWVWYVGRDPMRTSPEAAEKERQRLATQPPLTAEYLADLRNRIIEGMKAKQGSDPTYDDEYWQLDCDDYTEDSPERFEDDLAGFAQYLPQREPA
jgi:hypothetical protein